MINIKLDSKAQATVSKAIGASGISVVFALPEKGDVGALYKTPDGNIYSWFHEETTKEVEVPDIKAGDALLLLDSIDSRAFADGMNKILNVKDGKRLDTKLVSFNLENSVGDEGVILKEVSINCGYAADVEDPGNYRNFRFGTVSSGNNSAIYSWGDVRPTIVVELVTNFEEEPIIHITQELIDKLTANNISIEDIAFIFSDVPTKTEIITTVNEGYTQLNGIVLDYNNITHSTIYLDDKNYDAQIIYDTLLRGGNVILKSPQYNQEEATEPNYYTFENYSSVEYYPAEKNLSITFNGNTIDVVLENQFNPISTIKGQELIDLIQAYDAMEINNVSLIDYIGSVSSFEEANKELYRGIAISLFEGLIEYDLFYSIPPDEELVDSTLTQIAHFVPKAYRDTVLTAYPGKGQLNCLAFLAQYIGNGYVSNSNLSEIDATKDYNCDIIVKFSDGTTKTIPMDKKLLYGIEGDDESPLFRVHIMN